MGAINMIVEVKLMHLHSVELESALPPTFLHTSGSTIPQPHALNAGLEAIKAWFNVFFAIPPAAYVGFPFSVFSQLMRCLVALYRIRTLDDPVWNKGDAWEVLMIMDRIIAKMKQVPVHAALDNGNDPEGDTFSRTARLLGSVRAAWEGQLRSDALKLSNAPPPLIVDDPSLPNLYDMGFLDNDWLSDFLPPTTRMALRTQEVEL